MGVKGFLIYNMQKALSFIPQTKTGIVIWEGRNVGEADSCEDSPIFTLA